MASGRCIIAAVWIDTHCHLDAAEFDADRDAVVAAARAAGVATIVLPAVDAGNFDRVRELAHRHRLAYALGIHPMCTGAAGDADLAALRAGLEGHPDDPRLVAVGEIGLDHFVAGLDREHQAGIFAAQLKLAREFDLPVLLHVRRAIDSVLKQLRTRPVRGGIAHAFNGSEQQAGAFVELGFKLGFGGALTFERALRIRRVAAAVPLTRHRHGDRCPGHPAAMALSHRRGAGRGGDDAQRLGRAAAHRRRACRVCAAAGRGAGRRDLGQRARGAAAPGRLHRGASRHERIRSRPSCRK